MRVNGLYGHIQRNNVKAAILIASFLLLFMAFTYWLRLGPHILMSEADSQLLISTAFKDGKLVAVARGRSKYAIESFSDAAPRLGLKEVPSTEMANFFEKRQRRHFVIRGQDLARWHSPTDFERRFVAIRFEPEHLVRGPGFRFILGMRGPTLKERLQVGLGRISPLDRFGQGLLAIAVLYLVGAIWWNSQFIRYALRAKPVSRAEAPELYDVIENLAITAGVPCPAIEVIDTPALNAYASGLSPKTARLGVTTGLIAALDKSELEAVIAHELVHILQRDSRLMAVTKACVDLVLPRRRFFKANWRIFLALLFVFFSVFSLATLMVFASMLIAIAVLTLVAKALVLHAREFVADAGAVEITKNPVALISALRKIASSDEMTISNLATEAMMFTGSLKGVLGTHPRIEDRVAYIKKYAEVREDEVTLHTILSEREIGKSVAVSGPVFGRRRGKIVRAGAIAPPAAKRSIGTFPIEERRRAIWKDSRVFEPVEAATQGVTALAGETWFERWVMTGRLRKVRQRLARYVTSPIKYVGLTLLAFNLGFILFFWSRAFPLAGFVAASMALGAVLVFARLSNARRNS